MSLALYGHPRTARRLSVGSTLLRIGLAAGISAAIQALFLLTMEAPTALDVVLPPSWYRAFFGEIIMSQWLDWISLLDAALVGAVLAVGLIEGLTQANRLALWLQGLRERAAGLAREELKGG